MTTYYLILYRFKDWADDLQWDNVGALHVKDATGEHSLAALFAMTSSASDAAAVVRHLTPMFRDCDFSIVDVNTKEI